MRPRRRASLSFCLFALMGLAPPQQTSSVSPDSSAKTWIGRYQEVEAFLRTAECESMDDVSKSMPGAKRCVLSPGGPVARMIWKPLIPIVHRGFRESSTNNIAAYELDKLLKLDMVPPVVERELQGYKGAATFWVENVSDATGGVSPGGSQRAYWEKQLTRMRMFDSLIGNRDRNLANILRDAAWNMILLDHSRAFGTSAELRDSLDPIDQELWARIEKLTRQQLDGALSRWLDEKEIVAILERREKMRAEIKKALGRPA
jgi:hypothetical protein